MEQPSAAVNFDKILQRLAVNSSSAAGILINAVTVAQNWQTVQADLNRYIQQVLTWRRVCGAMKMAGSASKIVGGVMVGAAPLHPTLGLAARAGHTLWKLGAGLKGVAAVGSMLRNMWQVGCRSSLREFVKVTALLTARLGQFGEVIRDLQKCLQPLTTSNITLTPDQVLSLITPLIPPDLLEYVKHVVNIVYHETSYSPLIDILTTSAVFGEEPSNTAKLMLEIESYGFTEFVEQGSSQFLAAIGSLLHISHEVLVFLDGFKEVTDQDFSVLFEHFTRFSRASESTQRAANTLTNLAHLGGHYPSADGTNMANHGETRQREQNVGTDMANHGETRQRQHNVYTDKANRRRNTPEAT